MKKTIVCILIGLISILLIVVGMFALKGGNKTATLDFKYNEGEIEQFVNIICKNADVETAEVLKVEISGSLHLGAGYYSAELSVKPYDKVAEIVQVRFYNKKGSDMVSNIAINFHSYDSDNEMLCKAKIVEALETTLGGTFVAEQYIKRFSEGTKVSMLDDPKKLAEYFLSDTLKVKIHTDSSFGPGGWDGTYNIYKIDLMS